MAAVSLSKNIMSTFLRQQDQLNVLDDLRIKVIKPLLPPQILMEDIPLTAEATLTVKEARRGAESIIKMCDDRLLCIVGPCSIHDPKVLFV